MEEKEQYAFISYSSKNQQMADSVRMLFIEKSIPCWMAPYDIPAGSKYAYVINDALENCACLVLLLTNASQASQFVEREIERAITYNKPIIPMQLEDIELNSGFKFYIGNSQIIAVPEIYADSPQFRKVMESVCKFVGCEESLLRDNREECHDNGILHRVKQCRQIYTKWDVHSDGESSKEDSILQLFSKFDPSVKCTLRVRTLIQKKGKIAELSPNEKRIYENELTHIKSEIESGLCLLDSMKVNSNIVQILETIFFEWEQDNQFGCDLLIRHESLNSLRTQISTGASFPEDEVIKIGKDISLALNDFHKMNVIHGDIKPENIFVNRYGAYKLGYFDFANQLQHIDKRNIQQIRYTSTYVAPEQISGPYYDKRVDIYSLGLVLYQLSNSNKLPVAVASDLVGGEIQMRPAGAKLSPPSDVGSDLSAIILKACAFMPNDRYENVNMFYKALERISSETYKTPYIMQRNITECGAAALAMIFSYWGKTISLDQLCAETNVSPDGCNAGNIMRTAKRWGLDCHGYRKSLNDLLEVSMPCIIHWNACHFVVLEEVRGNRVIINDPAEGHREITLTELDEGFSGVVLTFSPTK